jgi:transposase-like protein
MVNKRKKYSPEEKAKIVLEVLREENTLVEISNKYEVSQQLISRWKSDFLANMPSVFDKKANETEKLKKQFEAEKAALERKIGELTIDIDWLKKKQEQALELARAGNKIISIIGARSKDHLILAEEMQSISENLYIATDDGTLGHKGFVTDILKEIIDRGEEIDLVVAIGPLVMMKAVSELTRPYEIRTVVSLNPIMVDGTGMCGACRVAVGQATKFACVDGPEFDGHQVNWSVAEIRARMFVEEEKQAMVGCGSGGECQCQKQG